MNRKHHIPKIPHAFFKWYCKRERYEELHGDLEEFYYERVAEKGMMKARLYYLWDVICCCQPYAWKKPKSQTNSNIIMFRNYFKTSRRSLMKSPLSSFINIFGLAAVIGVCVYVYSFAQWIYSIDQFHEHKNEVYLATFFADRDGTVKQNGKTPRPLGKMLREDFTHIKKVCRIEDGNVVLKYEDKVFHEKMRYADPEFLEMFTFPLKWGSPSSLADMNSIILSEDMSIKYFGEENPLDRDIQVIFGENNSKTFTIAGVAKAFPDACSIDFDFLINFKNWQVADPSYDMDDWSAFVDATLIQVADPTDLFPIEQEMEKYKILQNKAEDDWAIDSFAFEQLATLYEKGGDIRGDIAGNGFGSNYRAVVIISIITLMMLAMACFNYINIAIVSAAKRLKEIGLRKVVGASRKMVITQFLAENIFITSFALVFGFILGITIIIPWFERILDVDFSFSLLDKNFLIFMVSTLLFTGIASGMYPAFYISKFRVVGILKGSVKFGKKNPLTKVFLTFQLILACILISTAVMFTQNTAYLNDRSWGYNQGAALYAQVSDQSAYERLYAAMTQNPNVLSISGSSHHLGRSNTTTVVDVPDRQYEVQQLSVDANYFETMGVTLIDGRTFIDHHKSDKQAVVVNETLVENMALDKPIGQQFKIDSVDYEVIGVVKDFHLYSFNETIQPTLFKVANRKDYRYLSMKVNNGSEREVYKSLLNKWLALFPEIPFQGGYQEDVWGGYFEEIDTHAVVWNRIAIMAMLLVGLGLYGLVTLNVAGRTREFSIRKVLGAALKNIASNIISQYVILFAIALFIGGPISYFLVEWFFDFVYPYHVPMNSLGVVIAVTSLISLLLLVVSTQMRKVSKSNPVDGLKVE
ncbi:ABC transporter permease [Fulvivirgaceae bacterium BMA10]|uniref:ABC transporter permease n=1 Tax=Splendidivirga corallicola TaxID=3051826 RepID=A0ABT8KXF5_9BACT|nr:ABC transporter permease [Fulvivirgaceae bacterium BMA10]